MTRTYTVMLRLIKLTIVSFCLLIGGCMDDSIKSNKSSNSNLKIVKNTEQDQNGYDHIPKLALEEYGGISLTFDNQIDEFATEILGTNKVRHSAEDLSRLGVGHITIFNFDGLKNYYAYSDKRYPKKSLPTYYENFTVFVFEYQSEISASKSFRLIYANSNLTKVQLDSIRTNNPKLATNISTSLKPGGFICQKNNYIFSLVKTCRKPPVTNDWSDYEEFFIKSIATDDQAINTLNAKCGMMNYKFEKRKPIDNNM